VRNDSVISYNPIQRQEANLDALLLDHVIVDMHAQSSARGSVLNAVSPMAALQDLASFENKTEMSFRAACTHVSPLTSCISVECSPVDLKQYMRDLTDMTGGSSFSSTASSLQGVRLSVSPGPFLVIDEVLEPSSFTIPIARLFLSSIALPKLDQSFSVHTKRTQALVGDSVIYHDTMRSIGTEVTESNGSLFGDMEKLRQHALLTQKCTDLSIKYSEFVALIRVMAANMGIGANQTDTRWILKKSADKKLPVVGPLCTLTKSSVVQGGYKILAGWYL